MASKVVIKIVLAGVQVFGRAFMQAYQQAIHHKPPSGAGRQQAASASASSAKSDLTRRLGISLEESHKILNTSPDSSPSEIIQKYRHLFHVNDPKKKPAGSLYLQSKVYRAKERIEQEMGIELEKPGSKTKTKE
jgi:import inner membrane translocase subunit TIM16